MMNFIKIGIFIALLAYTVLASNIIYKPTIINDSTAITKFSKNPSIFSDTKKNRLLEAISYIPANFLTYLELFDISKLFFWNKSFYEAIKNWSRIILLSFSPKLTINDSKLNQLISSFIISNFPNVKIKKDGEDTAYGIFSLAWASENGHTEIVRFFIENGAYENNFIFIQCSGKSHTNKARYLDKTDTDITIFDEHGRTPLLLALVKGHTKKSQFPNDKDEDEKIFDEKGRTLLLLALSPLISALKKGSSDIARFLIEKGADINVLDENGNTPLMLALEKCIPGIADILIKKGADINVVDKFGCTPLILALKKGHDKKARFLIERGADINFFDKNGRTPLSLASEKDYTYIVNLLIKKGANH